MENQIIEVPSVPSVTSVPEFRIGDYVFAGRWSDADWCDPWVVGYVSEVGEDWVKVGGDRRWGRTCVITSKQGESICKNYPLLANLCTPLDYQIVAKVWGVAKAKKLKTERKRPEFTFEDGVELAQDTCVHSGFLIVDIQYEDVFTDKDRLLATQEYLRNTNYFNEYGYKPLRKKLKLYIKWLQSEMSKKGE